MVTILDAAPPPPAASRGFAEAAWRANPALSPSWWRENLGFTHSKIALSTAVNVKEASAPPVNLWLHHASAGALPTLPPGHILLSLGPDHAQLAGDIAILQVTTQTAAELDTALHQLEARVRQGELVAYGLNVPALADPATPRPLHHWLSRAAAAAQAVHGRPKRPALRVLVQPFDLLEIGLLTTPNTRHKEELVAPLELAARLHLWVIATPCHHPDAPPPPAAALQALTELAAAEQAWHHSLQGQWPHVAGQPLFSVLHALGQGRAPWPTVPLATRWDAEVWPVLQAALATHPTSGPLRACWQAVRPHLPALAAAAAAANLQKLLQQLQPQLPPSLQALPPAAQQLAILSAVPGVGAVLAPAALDLSVLPKLPDLPDPGAWLA